MSARVSLVTLGVDDVSRSRRFYEALGFRASSASQADIVFFHGPGAILAIWARGAMAQDAGLDPRGEGFRATCLATNLASAAEVDAHFTRAIAAGARAVKPPHAAFWGGYTSLFEDPDGHLWEAAHNPFWPLDVDGLPELPA